MLLNHYIYIRHQCAILHVSVFSLLALFSTLHGIEFPSVLWHCWLGGRRACETIIIIIIITTTIFIVLSSTAPAICESSLWFIWAKVSQHQVAANSQAKLQTWPLSPPVGCYRPNIRPSPLVLLLNHKVDTHLPSLWGWKAESTYIGTAVSVQPVPKAAYRSDFRENKFLSAARFVTGPYRAAGKSATTRPLRPAKLNYRWTKELFYV